MRRRTLSRVCLNVNEIVHFEIYQHENGSEFVLIQTKNSCPKQMHVITHSDNFLNALDECNEKPNQLLTFVELGQKDQIQETSEEVN